MSEHADEAERRQHVIRVMGLIVGGMGRCPGCHQLREIFYRRRAIAPTKECCLDCLVNRLKVRTHPRRFEPISKGGAKPLRQSQQAPPCLAAQKSPQWISNSCSKGDLKASPVRR
jgi:hypothetical protein